MSEGGKTKLQLREGAYYKTREGRVSQATYTPACDRRMTADYRICDWTFDGMYYQNDGRFADNTTDGPSDIVCECDEHGNRLVVAAGAASLLPIGSQERKDTPIYSGVLAYFPRALSYVAKVSKQSNAKHNGPEAPLGWTKGISNDHADCIARHLVEHGSVDPDDNLKHSGKLAWRALALLEIELENEAKKESK